MEISCPDKHHLLRLRVQFFFSACFFLFRGPISLHLLSVVLLFSACLFLSFSDSAGSREFCPRQRQLSLKPLSDVFELVSEAPKA